MCNRLLIFSITILACMAMASLASGQTCQDVHGTTGFAPSPFEGSEVTLTGIVYVAPGTFYADRMYFQCPGGAGGMALNDPSLVGLLNLGDEISVTGTVGTGSRTEIMFDDGALVTILSHGNPEVVTPIGSGELDEGFYR